MRQVIVAGTLILFAATAFAQQKPPAQKPG